MIATKSHQIREQVVQIPRSIFISKNYQNDTSKWPDIKDNDQRCQVVRRYGVSKMSVSFKYQLKRLCDVLSWSVYLRYQLVRRYNVSNWSVLFAYQWDVTKMSEIVPPQIVPTNWRTSCDVMMMSQHDLGRSSWSLKWANFFCVLCSKLPWRLQVVQSLSGTS